MKNREIYLKDPINYQLQNNGGNGPDIIFGSQYTPRG